MKYREAQKIARVTAREFGLPKDATLDFIRQKLESQRHRGISIVEIPGLSGSDVCGMWLVCADRDIVLHAPAKSGWHRQQIILHEFSHMILHHDDHVPDADTARSVLPDVDAVHVLRALTRSSYDTEAELTAEVLADELASRIIKGAASSSPEPLAFREVFG